ncbi:DUF3500 domain-containing protein [Streptomyces rishiriensis]|uniref:Uncharacterized protein n=1 Tax=Streptomyces rishiriensis TaxID=68264 RepID=A0ABU0NIP3_STRRH|nr:DUF3500 domain-containing protein [Streptomyces rishiriensis]MDQ0578940.1 hypothetical protein [Streptomyces rishiriensis]
MKEVEDHLDDTYFYWIGETEDSSAFYYRVHSPVALIGYDARSPLAYGTEDSDGGGMGGPGGTPAQQHIHTVIRTPNGGDYGVDLLKPHLENDHQRVKPAARDGPGPNSGSVLERRTPKRHGSPPLPPRRNIYQHAYARHAVGGGRHSEPT